ncbi:multiple epidermal growth factor-like domains protein 9 [Corythoichthys intestinalis]|uniref:multiple epidermal growth factor-like domains protein 9 n=1 Tax=Corythoichthys intestinalis TaxID=161448 RepID=UPI0025A51764|nr:multiple epidermal growth factor-like domains protein 9 [Corythoichthys intestinalis]XP_061803752.1 multiple epidermal growth factor-like domains protein 9 [Nerophis lumbriciformis]
MRQQTAPYAARRHQWWSTHPFRERSDRDRYWGLHGELRLNMRFTSLMMYISSVLVFILYVYIDFSEAAPRISLYDASPISRKPDTASDTWKTFHTDTSRRLPDNSFLLTQSSAIGIASHIPQNAFPSAPTEPTTTDFDSGIISNAKEEIALLTSRLKRSTDAHGALFAPEKTLQTMMSMVSQRSANDAWSADTSVTSVENSQDGFCNCSTGGEGILYPDECNQSTGQCSCLDGYTGLQCDECEEGYFTNGTSGCLPCACDSFGAESHLCDSSGICVCKAGVYGPKCDECHPGFFHFSSTGCQPCQCHNHTNYCHPQSGVCLNCEGNTQGSNCEECKPDHYRSRGTALTEACVLCPCSNSSSTGTCHADPSGSPVCDQCLHPYSGSLCDQCSAGFHKAQGACVPCDCSGNADPQGPTQVCHPDTGHCLSCINNTTGPRCQLCAPGFSGDARAHNCSRQTPQHIFTPAVRTTTEHPTSSTSSSFSSTPTTTRARNVPVSTSDGNLSTTLSTTTTTQALLTSLSSPTDNTTAALTDVSWTQFNIIILAVIILVVVVLLGFVGGVYTYREYQNRKLNAPFWTIELKEDNISFSSYHDSIPNADVSGLLEDETNEVAPNGQLALTTQGNCYKA